LDIAVQCRQLSAEELIAIFLTHHLTYTLLKMIGNLNGNAKNFGNNNHGIIGDVVSTQP
jgi:hypothetical protein